MQETGDVFTDMETLDRYLNSFRRIADLRCLSEPYPFAVIVPAEEIEGFEQFAFTDVEWRVFSSEYVPAIPDNQVYVVLDFPKLRRADRAMLFAFLSPDHNHWLRFLLKVKRLGVLNGPNGPLSTALSVDLSSPGFEAAVRAWLSKGTRP